MGTTKYHSQHCTALRIEVVQTARLNLNIFHHGEDQFGFVSCGYWWAVGLSGSDYDLVPAELSHQIFCKI